MIKIELNKAFRTGYEQGCSKERQQIFKILGEMRTEEIQISKGQWMGMEEVNAVINRIIEKLENGGR